MDRQKYEEIKQSLGFKPAPASSGPRVILPVRVEGNLAYVSGHVPFSGGELLYKGRIGVDVSIEEAKKSAALSVINCLESLDREIGLDKVDKILKVNGFLSCADHVTEHPVIMNAGSEVLIGVFGSSGEHARAALGIHTLPLGSSTEVDMIVSLKA
ncbi:RidA family protein [Paenibacillus sp. GYB004]|uniref:RidA family protein n=1 Tax=Paenibacillus sp. GYB004 TaxID=2994393 RepID=UPI002F9639BF